jgi:hypothetical protein
MKELLEKVSSYNLFNYLFPGAIFVAISKSFTGYDFTQSNEIVGLFLYYFIGMIISRFGSLIIEPLLKSVSFLKFAAYEDYINASKKDAKIDLLSEANNTYRTLVSMIILLIIIKLYRHFHAWFNIPEHCALIAVVILVLLMFLFSYKKQTNYITKRIQTINKP